MTLEDGPVQDKELDPMIFVVPFQTRHSMILTLCRARNWSFRDLWGAFVQEFYAQ